MVVGKETKERERNIEGEREREIGGGKKIWRIRKGKRKEKRRKRRGAETGTG